MNTQNEQSNSYERALAYAADQGINIPDEIKQKAEAARFEVFRQEQEAAVARNATKGRFQRMIDAYIERYPKLQDGVTKLGNWLMALIKLFTVNIGATVVMFGVMVAEILRVRTGLAAIEASPLAVELLSIVLVFLLFFLEVAGFYIEREGNYETPKRFRWSVRILLQDLKYSLGIGKDWEVREISPARRMILTKWIIQLSVAFIALYGSMAHIVKGHNGNWSEALRDILSNSSLDEMSSWGIGLLLTIGILFGSTAMIWFVASRAKKLEDADFAVGEDKIELLGWKRAGDIITTFTTDTTRERRERRRLISQPSTASPANMPHRSAQSGAISLADLDNVQPVQRTMDTVQSVQPVQLNSTLYEQIRVYLDANPDAVHLSARKLQARLNENGIIVKSQSTVNNVLSLYKTRT